LISHYFDHAASSPVLPEVLDAMLPWLGAHCGNEHSLHAWGREARAAVEDAREAVAELIGAEDPSQIVFTSGATEGNNAVVGQFDRVVFSPFEHSSVREAALVRPHGEMLPPSPPQQGRGRQETLPQKGEGAGETLVCQMAVSNETGEIFNWSSAGRPVLVDATQAVGKVAFHVAEADFVTISGHKVGGPKGVGALYMRDPEGFEPLLRGGGHEHGLRSGTLNVPGIVGLGVAARLAQRDHEARHAAAAALRDAFVNSLEGAHMRVNQAMNQSPFIVSVTCFGWLAGRWWWKLTTGASASAPGPLAEARTRRLRQGTWRGG